MRLAMLKNEKGEYFSRLSSGLKAVFVSLSKEGANVWVAPLSEAQANQRDLLQKFGVKTILVHFEA